MASLTSCLSFVLFSVWCAQDREDAGGSGLDVGLSSSRLLQTGLCPSSCSDGLPCEGRRASREEGQLGANQGPQY